MNILRLLWTFFRLGAINELQYRVNFWVQMVQSAVSLATALAGLGVVFAHTDTLAGWRLAELLAVVGVYFLVGGLINLAVLPSMYRLMNDVRQGTLDFTLTKPADAQLLISARQVEVWKLVDILLGCGVIGVALWQLGTAVGPGQAAVFALMLVCGTAIVYSFLLMLSTCAFWFVRVDNILVIFQSMYEAGRWPVGIYPTWLRYSLTFLVPVAFAITVPAEALAGRLAWPTTVGALALTIMLLGVSRWFWQTGVRRYSGASA